MMHFIAPIQKIIRTASTETDDQTADRLAAAADRQGVDPETLYRLEKELNALLSDVAEDGDPNETIAELAGLAAQALGIPVDGTAALDLLGLDWPVVKTLLAQTATENADALAVATKLVHDYYAAQGYYGDLGVYPRETNIFFDEDPLAVWADASDRTSPPPFAEESIEQLRALLDSNLPETTDVDADLPGGMDDA